MRQLGLKSSEMRKKRDKPLGGGGGGGIEAYYDCWHESQGQYGIVLKLFAKKICGNVTAWCFAVDS